MTEQTLIKKKKLPFYKYLSFTLIFMSILVLSIIYFIDTLPKDYFLFTVGIFIMIDGLLILLMNGKKRRKIFGGGISLFLIVIMILGTVYEINTLTFLKKFGYTNYEVINYLVLTNKNSMVDELTDLDNDKIGVLRPSTKKTAKANKYLTRKIVFTPIEKQNTDELFNNLANDKVAAILIEKNQLEKIIDLNPAYKDNYKQIYEFVLELKR